MGKARYAVSGRRVNSHFFGGFTTSLQGGNPHVQVKINSSSEVGVLVHTEKPVVQKKRDNSLVRLVK